MLKTAKTKYPTRVGKTLFDKATNVELLNVNDKSIQEKFPNIKENPDSTFVAVKFPNCESFTIVDINQITIEEN